MPVQKSFLQMEHSREDRNLALLCLVASGGITVGAPELQDDSALSSLCLLCRRKLIYRNVLNCCCVMSGNQRGKRGFKGGCEKKEETRTAEKMFFQSCEMCTRPLITSFLRPKGGTCFLKLKTILMDRRGWNLPGIKFWHEFAERIISCRSFPDFLFHSLPCSPQLE